MISWNGLSKNEWLASEGLRNADEGWITVTWVRAAVNDSMLTTCQVLLQGLLHLLAHLIFARTLWGILATDKVSDF